MISQNKPLIRNHLLYLAIFLFVSFVSLFIINRLYFHPLPIFNNRLADQKIEQAKDMISRKQFDQALSIASPLDSFPETHQKTALYVYAESYFGLKDWPESMQNYQNILIMSNDKSEISELETKIALCLQELGKQSEAINHLNIALRANSKNNNAWVSLINIYLQRNEDALAQETLNKALSAIPDNPNLNSMNSQINT